MTTARLAWHVGVWAVVYAFWLIVTRDNQPTLAVAVVATGLLTGTAALAVYADWYALRPRFAAARHWGAYTAGLFALVTALTFPTVVAIQAVYDAAGVPAEGRFGFWTNVGYEVAWYVLHLAAAAALLAAQRAVTINGIPDTHS